MVYAVFQLLFVIWLVCFVIVPCFLCALAWCESHFPPPAQAWFALLRKWLP
jgi:hypothetical protein